MSTVTRVKIDHDTLQIICSPNELMVRVHGDSPVRRGIKNHM